MQHARILPGGFGRLLIFNGFSKKKCTLERNIILVEGVSHQIGFATQLEGYDVKVNFLVKFIAILGVPLFAFFALGLRESVRFIYIKGVNVGMVALIVFNLSLGMAYLWLLRYFYYLRGYRGYWGTRLRGNKLLLLEETDGDEVLANLMRLRKEDINS